ncbi:MAG: hypothetical protein IPG77_11670 [Betaproteobacteria bacterium]|nr:hypothetical protein [Betaproteobacteria bacterium]
MLCNTQSELHPLEEGKHAAESGMDLKAYAAASGKPEDNQRLRKWAWTVLRSTDRHVSVDQWDRDHWRCYAELHAAPQWLWPALVEKMTTEAWTVATTREKVGRCKEWQEPPAWSDKPEIAVRLVAGEARYADISRMGDATAYMQLVLCNTQSELHPLEEGKHAAESGMDLKAYAAASGKEYVALHDKVKAWRVYSPVMHVHKAPAEFRHLTAIHAAPSWLWGALVEKMTSEARLVAALGWNNVPPAELSKGLAGERTPVRWISHPAAGNPARPI